MNDLYPYCSKCDAELTKNEKEMNEQHDNLFYPICEKCLDKHVKEISKLADTIETKK